MLVTDKLRCRMAYSFFVTMGIYETIVYTEDDYVQKAVDLGLNKSLREKISARMQESSPKIWERLEVVDAWARFFQRAYRSSAYGGTDQYVYKGPCKVNVTGGMVQQFHQLLSYHNRRKAHLKLAIRIHHGAKKLPKSRMLVCRLKK